MTVGSESQIVTPTTITWKVDSDDSNVYTNGTLFVDNNEAVGELKVTATYNGTPGTSKVKVVAKPGIGNSKSIKEKFGIAAKPTGTAEAVAETFGLLHEFIQAGGLEYPETKDMIKLGDWIDLEGGLVVDGSEADGGFSFNSINYTVWDTEKTVGSANGKLGRLIVAGINSFQTGKGNGSYTYPKDEPQPPSHVVFQFQNIPVERRMNTTGGNAGGYLESEMRRYLTQVEDAGGNVIAGTGKFLEGLIAAGVPEGALWGPARVVSSQANYSSYNPYALPVRTKIKDKLWLPTAVEFGIGEDVPVADETGSNQAKLEYNGNLAKFGKNGVGHENKRYWLASPSVDDTAEFLAASNDGSDSSGSANDSLGVAPAFCVQ
jgi:hypothetical protein